MYYGMKTRSETPVCFPKKPDMSMTTHHRFDPIS
jgi:hypothetical protein